MEPVAPRRDAGFWAAVVAGLLGIDVVSLVVLDGFGLDPMDAGTVGALLVTLLVLGIFILVPLLAAFLVAAYKEA